MNSEIKDFRIVDETHSNPMLLYGNLYFLIIKNYNQN